MPAALCGLAAGRIAEGERPAGGDSQRRIETNPLRVLDSKLPEEQAIIEGLPRIADHLCESCREHFARLQDELKLRGIAYEMNWRLVRGLDYYMRTTFEIVATGLGRRTRCAAAGATMGWWSCSAGRRRRALALRSGPTA